MTGSSPRDYVDQTKHRDKILERREVNTSYDNEIDRWAYKLFGNVFEDKEEFLEEYQDTLKSAQIPVGSDLYLARMIVYAILAGFGGLLLTGFISTLGIATGAFAEMAGSGVAGVIFGLVIVFFGTILISGGSAGLYYAYPTFKANRRASAIDTTLPSAVTFMYALNRGGMSIAEVMRTLAENEDVYGEVSREISTAVQDMEFFSRDMMSALRRSGQRSPSSKYTDFMDDMVATLDSGASMSPFLEGKADDLIEEAERDQENFIETLSLMGEVYVTAFVAGPLFMIIITVIMAMMGGAEPTQLDGIVYALLPFMNVAFFFLIDFLAGTDEDVARQIPIGDTVHKRANVDLDAYVENGADERVQRVYEAKKKRERTALIRQPITELLRNPNLTLVFSAPLTLVYLIIVLLFGLAEPSGGAFIDAPVEQTVFWLLIPIFIVTVPLSIFFEISSRRQRKVMGRLPEALKQLASANSVGMTLTESLETTAENTSGRLGEELSRVKNDIKWNHDVNTALIKFSNRVQIPILTRTTKLITQANESTGDIEDVLEVAAKNVETQVRLEKERSQAMMMYTAVILISFAVYMFVIALLDIQFLSTIGGMDGAGDDDLDMDGGEFELDDLPTERFRLVFYHSTIVQAFGSGMIAGYLKSNDVRSGLKFAIVLSLASSAIFFVLT